MSMIRPGQAALVALALLACIDLTIACNQSKQPQGQAAAPIAETPPAAAPGAPAAGAAGTAAVTSADPSSSAGAGGSGPAAAAGAEGGAPPGPTEPGAQGDPDCKGFEVLGLQYSPGGNVLPNTCLPYHPLTNNPYAIRCIDADPSYQTPFPGDEYCILPPPPELGLQFGVHPASYEPADTAAYALEPGEETNQNYFAKTANTEQRYFFRSNVRMRTGSHHLISTGGSMAVVDGWEGDRKSAGIGILAPGFETTLPSAQRADQDTPPGLVMPTENEGLAFKLAPQQQVQFNLHHFNASDGTILREVWINVWFIPPDQVKTVVQPLALIGALADVEVPPGESRKLTYGCMFENARMVALTGHRHANTDRFGVWLEQNGASTPLYESFDYNDMPTYNYDSLTQNPTMDVAAKTDGAASGVLDVRGGTLKWTCEINNRSDQTLTFSNELYTGEMCIVFGAYVGTGPDCDLGVVHYELLPLLGPFTDVIL